MSNSLINRVLEHSKQKGAVRLVALILANFADDNGTGYVSKKIAKYANADERNVRLALEQLQISGELVLLPKDTGPARYQLSPERSRGEARRTGKGTIEIVANAIGSGDPKIGSGDPKIGSGDPKIGSGDPRFQILKDSKFNPEEGAKRPAAPVKPRAAAKKKESDPRANHPAIKAIRELAQCYPHKGVWGDLITVLGDEPDMDRLTACFKAWVSSNKRNPTNFAWALEWYRPGVLEKKTNYGVSKTTSRATAAASSAALSPEAKEFLKRQSDR